MFIYERQSIKYSNQQIRTLQYIYFDRLDSNKDMCISSWEERLGDRGKPSLSGQLWLVTEQIMSLAQRIFIRTPVGQAIDFRFGTRDNTATGAAPFWQIPNRK